MVQGWNGTETVPYGEMGKWQLKDVMGRIIMDRRIVWIKEFDIQGIRM